MRHRVCQLGATRTEAAGAVSIVLRGKRGVGGVSCLCSHTVPR
jgi:hypothetical protein